MTVHSATIPITLSDAAKDWFKTALKPVWTTTIKQGNDVVTLIGDEPTSMEISDGDEAKYEVTFPVHTVLVNGKCVHGCEEQA